MTLLHLDSSANRTGESVTRRLTARFAAAWRAANGDAGYRYRDLAADPVPPLDTAFAALGRRTEQHGVVALGKVSALASTPAEERQWALTLPLIEEVRAASTILIGAPMYNLSVPASLKAWIDRVSFPGGFADPDTGESVLGGTRVVVIGARGGVSRAGHPDFHTQYLRAYFQKHGVRAGNIECVTAELTLAGLVPHLAHRQDEADRSLSAAYAAACAAAHAAVASAK